MSRRARSACALAAARTRSACVSGPHSCTARRPTRNGRTAGETTIGILLFGDTATTTIISNRRTTSRRAAASSSSTTNATTGSRTSGRPAEFRPPADDAAPRTARWVAASGMMPVANAMHELVPHGARCDFAVMLGDNIYPDGATLGADGRDDANASRDLLRAVQRLAAIGPDFRIYAVLGNHDWKTSRAARWRRSTTSSARRLSTWTAFVYRVAPPAAPARSSSSPSTRTVLLAGQTVYKDALADDASELPADGARSPKPWVGAANASERDMVAWLERALARIQCALEDRRSGITRSGPRPAASSSRRACCGG